MWLYQSLAQVSHSGLYLRDLQNGHTTQIVSGNVSDINVTADGTTASFLSPNRLVPTAPNSRDNLYLVNIATKALTLVPTGATSGDDGERSVRLGAISRDGRSVVWTLDDDSSATHEASFHLALTPGADRTSLGDAALAPAYSTSSNDGFNAKSVSDDGRTVLVADQVWRDGVDLGTAAYGAVVSGDGKTVAWVGDIVGTTANVYKFDVATGAVTHQPLNAVVNYEPAVHLNADGTQLTIQGKFTSTSAATGIADVATGAVHQIGPTVTGDSQQPTVLSSNEQFALLGAWPHVFAYPFTAAALPGTLDPPSAFVYLSYDSGCKHGPGYSSGGVRSSLTFAAAPAASPKATSAAITVRQLGTNTVLAQFTLTSGAAHPMAIGYGNWSLTASVKLADGRTVTDKATQPAYTPDACQEIPIF